MSRIQQIFVEQRFSLRQILCAAALLGAGAFIGSHVTQPSPAEGQQIISTPQQQHMLSGGQLSVPILQDISATLKVMDTRLQRMEEFARQMKR